MARRRLQLICGFLIGVLWTTLFALTVITKRAEVASSPSIKCKQDIAVESIALDEGQTRNSSICPEATWLLTEVKTFSVYAPQDVFVDSMYNLYVVDYYNNQVLKWEKGSVTSTVIAGGNGQGVGSNQLNHPEFIVVDKSETMFITNGGRVTRWKQGADSGVTIVTVYAGSMTGIAMDDREEYIYVVQGTSVVRYDKDGKNAKTVAGGNGHGSALNQIAYGWSIAIDKVGAIYISDAFNNRIVKWPTNAAQGILIHSENGYNNSNKKEVKAPLLGIFVDNTGALYVADQYNNRVLRILSESLNTKVIVGGIRAGCGFNELSTPMDVTTDAEGNLYVSVLDCNMVFMYKIDKSPCNCSCTYRN